MNELQRYISNLLSSIFYRIRCSAEYAADRKVQEVINQQMHKRDHTKRQEP